MPRYYFDFNGPKNIWRDAEGLDFSQVDVACDEMRRTMLEMAKDLAVQDGKLELTGVVRDSRETIWRGRLLLEADEIATV